MITAHDSFENTASLIQGLLDLKSKRDNIKFNSSKLAKAIDVDRSLIQRIMKGDVSNPRIDTLMKIAKFFIEDGFPITLDDLAPWGNTNVVDIRNQQLSQEETKTLPLFLMNNFNGEKIATVPITLPKFTPGLIAVVSNNDLEPLFKAGSIFIIDMEKNPEHENMVMTRISSATELSINKYICEDGGQVSFMPYASQEDKLTFNSAEDCKSDVIGVVIRINAKL